MNISVNGTHSCHIPSRIPSPVSGRSMSINSTHTQNQTSFWKAGSECPITTSFRRRPALLVQWQKHDILGHLKTFWKYAKWPIFLLLSCLVLGFIIFFLFVGSQEQFLNENDNIMSANFSDQRTPPVNFIDDNRLENDYVDDNGEIRSEEEEILTIFMKNPSGTTKRPEIIDEFDVKQTSSKSGNNEFIMTEVEFDLETGDNKDQIMNEPFSTTKHPLRNTQILKFTTQKGFKIDEDILETTEKVRNISNDRTILSPLPPTKETMQVIGFTSGHQNNFGIPIEEDERVLRLLNDELIRYESREATSRPTTESTTTVKVSPTLPLIIHHKDTSPSGLKSTTESQLINTTDVRVCQSTTLDICQGVLQYDLTTSKSKRQLESIELEHFNYLFDSKCSNRAAEFVCSALEPECRPTQMGALQPCKRICKSILEPCASIIASSEILTMTFDCDRYPDSSDRNECEDPTRRGKCYVNEFQCLDSTCIPKQWKCDNIKDCSLGEDEDDCTFCSHEEFRCQSDGKCIQDKWRCDQYEDCADASDESECYDYDEDLDDDYLSSRIYSFASIQSPDSPDGRPFLAIPIDEDGKDDKARYEGNGGLFGSELNENKNSDNDNNQTSNETSNEEIQTGEASGRVVVGIPQNLANFQDSKEIMMTSDSENDFKYSKVRGNRSRNTTSIATSTTMSKRVSIGGVSTTKRTATTVRRLTSTVAPATTPLNNTSSSTAAQVTPAKSTTTKSTTGKSTTAKSTTAKLTTTTQRPFQYCPDNQLRCVSGKCITVDQLCNKKIDCPDGADEARCVYKDN